MVFLTDRAFATNITLDDVFHTVQPGDASGTSYKVTFNQLKTLLSGPFGIANSTGFYTYYNTLQLAINAASSGQTVEVFTDYTETGNVSINLKNGVDINFNGHTYTLNFSGSTNAFSDNGITVNCRLLNGIIVRTGFIGGGTGANLCLYLTGPSTIETDCQFKSNCECVQALNSLIKIIGGRYFSSASANNVDVVQTSGTINNAYIEFSGSSNTNYGLRLSGGTANNCTIYGLSNFGGGIIFMGIFQSVINNCIIDVAFVGVVMSGGTMTNSYSKSSGSNSITCFQNSIILNSTIITESTSPAISLSSNTNGASVNGCTIYGIGGQGINNSGTNSEINNCFIYSNTQCFVSTQGGAEMYGCSLYSLTATSIILTSLGNFTSIKNCVCTSASNPAITVNCQPPVRITNTVAESLWNNAAGHSIVFGFSFSGYTVAFCHLITSNTTANGINGNSNGGVRYVNNVFDGMTTPVFNITQLTTNVGDTRGNIQT